ncbi:hypothetical protein CJ030_MR3G005575 [Morella rubra]|uniref:Uncharacterized protein n=1 Tax=Morella rubra TaxID=262757 RepID=A0A6A1W8R8_9ROSI|nr:hypothetical protein CJ030_MR3G005575 [Morella rubra]
MDDNVDFTRPKSLAELKVVKNVDSRGQQSLGKRKNVEDHQQCEGHLSFERPKPLSEILKKKRDAKGAAYGSGKLFINKEEDNQREINESLLAGSGSSAVADAQIIEEEADSHLLSNKEESKYTAAVAVGTLMIRGMETMNMRKLMRENKMLRELRMQTLRRSTWMMKMGMTSLWRLVSCSHDCGEGENVTEGTQSSAKHRTLSTLPASHCLCLQYTQVCSLQLSTPMSILTWVARVSSKLSPPAVQGGSKEAMDKENIYVHPLFKRSSSSDDNVKN